MAAKKTTVKKKKDGKQGEGGGRPVSVDMTDPKIIEQVKIFGGVCATQQEMADWFSCSIKTIEAYMANEEGEVYRVYKKAQATFKSSLRSKQRNVALKGNTSMLIWLGKQLLGQKDRHDHTTDDKPIIMPILEIERDI